MSGKTSVFIFDLDGTLLNDEKIISQQSKDIIAELKEKEYSIILASGRHYIEMQKYAEELQLSKNDFLICCNGQYIRNGIGEIVHAFQGMTFEEINDIANIVNNINFLISTSFGDIYFISNFLKKMRFRFYMLRNKKKNTVISNINKLKHYEFIFEKIILDKSKVSLKNYEALSSKYSIHLTDDIKYEIQKSGINKFSAIKTIINIAGFSLDDVVYFGNDNNDLECFENIELTVSPNNAINDIKKISKYIIGDNNSNDLAIFLKRFI